MRHNPSRRSRSRSRKGPNPLTRSYESNGPDVKVRGTASTVAEKYVTLARDAHSSGDSVAAENYLQHAEHYIRIVMAAQAQLQPNQPSQHRDGSDDYDEDRGPRSTDRFSYPGEDSRDDDDGYDGEEDGFRPPQQAQQSQQPQHSQQPQQQRSDRQDGGDRNYRPDRNGQSDRQSDRPRYDDRSRSSRSGQDSRSPGSNRSDQNGSSRPDYGDRSSRSDRGDGGGDRYPRSERTDDNRGQRSDRSSGNNGGDRSSSAYAGNDRPSGSERQSMNGRSEGNDDSGRAERPNQRDGSEHQQNGAHARRPEPAGETGRSQPASESEAAQDREQLSFIPEPADVPIAQSNAEPAAPAAKEGPTRSRRRRSPARPDTVEASEAAPGEATRDGEAALVAFPD